ncbi:MAG: hypothetical protein ABEK01_01300 [Candidatus Nanohaloarchaea archaeon]
MVKTMYVSIPKEKAASILSEYSNYYVDQDTGEEIIVKKETAMTSNKIRAKLTDHKIAKEKIQTGSGSAESGVIGARVDYYKDKVKGLLEEHEAY